MKQAMMWMAIGTTAATVMLLVVVGPTRLYGLAYAVEREGKVAKLQPYGEGESEIPRSYVVEIHGEDRQVYLFISSDVKWSLASSGDHVRVRLYPAAPWSNGSGNWQNASLTAKLMPPEQAPSPTKVPPSEPATS